MKKMKQLANSRNFNIEVFPPFEESVITQRHDDYIKLSNIQFAKKYRMYLYQPALIKFEDDIIEIQMNKCSNPFCGSFNQPQKKFTDIKGNPSRYKIVSNASTDFEREQGIHCNRIENEPSSEGVFNHNTQAISNWSVAEEIKRLVLVNSVVPIEKDYTFHKDECININKNPFTDVKDFYKRGKSSSNSQKYQCKECKKITNVLPAQDESFNYHQKRNDLLLEFTKDILSRSPVKRTCEKFEIASGTYYKKLEWVYRKCLEFLERNESERFKNITFDDFWINTDTFNYNLNNIKQKGFGGKKSIGQLEKKLSTYVVASCELKSGYVLRNDVAYDYNISMEQIDLDTRLYHCDHSYNFLRKNGRLRYPYAPQTPTEFDSQTMDEYLKELKDYDVRKNYVDGIHVRTHYTTIAHYFLINRMINVSNRINFISDDDTTLHTAIFRVFPEKFSNNQALLFTCQADKTLTLNEAGSRCFQHRSELVRWGKEQFSDKATIEEFAYAKLLDELKTHEFFKYKNINGIDYPHRGKNPIKHPLPSKDEGERYVNIISPINNMSSEELTNLILQVNNRAIDSYFQTIRRKISILERPLVTARGDGKSYIYANYNPKYAQYILTILRTIYNFCLTQGSSKEQKKTPAMKLGIADKVYSIKDIIYFR